MQTDYAAYHLNEGDDDGLRVYLQKMTLCLFFSLSKGMQKNSCLPNFFWRPRVLINKHGYYPGQMGDNLRQAR